MGKVLVSLLAQVPLLAPKYLCYVIVSFSPKNLYSNRDVNVFINKTIIIYFKTFHLFHQLFFFNYKASITRLLLTGRTAIYITVEEFKKNILAPTAFK